MPTTLFPTKQPPIPELTYEFRGKTFKVVALIAETYEYHLFKFLKENRPIDVLHAKRLAQSIRKQYLICPIIVNDKFEVIDGQHRLKVAKELGKPVYFFVMPDYGLEEVQRLNSTQSKWNKKNNLHSFCEAGREPYLVFRKFMQDFPELSFQACERILVGTHNGRRTGDIEGHRAAMKDFEEGLLVIPDLEHSYWVAQRIMEFKPFYEGVGKGVFASLLLTLLKNEKYVHSEMLHKLTVCPTQLRDSDRVNDYKEQFEKIYNYKRPNEQKVSFRYA